MLKNITKTKFVLFLTLMIPLFASASSLTTLQTCQSCHGLKGEGVKNFTPMLAGLDARYLDQQIKLFQTGRRVNLMMTPMAELVADPKEREKIIAFFSSLPAPEITSLEFRGDHAKITDPARRLVYQGDWTRNIPACATCHGASGMGVADIPRLANQRPEYLEIQLQQWQTGLRRGDTTKVMSTIASQLTKTEIKQLAAYFASIK